MIAAACAAEAGGGSGSGSDEGDGGDSSASGAGAGGGDASTGSGAGDPGQCSTDVPCAGDSDCVALPGTRCNEALPAPRCQTLQCAPEGATCDDPALCQLGLRCLALDLFGREGDTVQGQCVGIEEVRVACLDACLAAPSLGPPCPANQLNAVCSHACQTYPEGWDTSCGEVFGNDLNTVEFLGVYCDDFGGFCQLDVECMLDMQHISLETCG